VSSFLTAHQHDFMTDVARARAGHLLRNHHRIRTHTTIWSGAPRSAGGVFAGETRETASMAEASAQVGGGSPTPTLSDDQVTGSVADPIAGGKNGFPG